MSNADPVDTFRQEATDLLETLEATLLDLERASGDRGLIDTAFRALHTIKGSGAMFGFDQVASFTHEFETAFDLLRQGRIEPNADIIAISLSAKDHIRALIEGSSDEIIGEAILDELRRHLGAVADVPVAALPQQASETPGSWSIRIGFAPGILLNGTNPLALLDDLRALGPCEIEADLSRLPPLDELDPSACLLGWSISLTGARREEIEDVFFFTSDDMTLTIAPTAETEAAPAQAVPQVVPSPTGSTDRPATTDSAARRVDTQGNTVRVQAERLDDLMDRVGELVIAQARLTQLAMAAQDPAFKSIAEEIERLAAGLRHATMGVRMVPMGTLFGRFRRLLHDLSRDLGKPVELTTSGEDTELDKTMIERLADPLVHIIRNAIDHGIESPDQRHRAGKPAAGRITLAASHVGAQVVVTVSDDGAGLDTDRIRAKAEEQGLIASGAVLSEHDIHQFLFHPGFSTARTISALSGRGVGMDVVKRTIEMMRGSVELSTVRGRGTNATLRLPLTLAIIEGLLVRVGAVRYILPLSAVEECIEMRVEDDRRQARSFLNVRGALVPFLRLRSLFDEPGPPDPHPKAIIVTAGETRVGLVVDQILGSHQTVIKSMSKLHADVAHFSGATILGDGTAALILDVTQIIAHAAGDPTHLQEAA